MKCVLSFLILLAILGNYSINCFVPAKLISYIIENLDQKTKLDFGQASETIVHEEILRRGMTRSIVRYFYEQENGTKTVNMKKMDTDYYDLKKLYLDYYGRWFCNLEIEDLIKNELQIYTASVDLDPRTKDLPYAHFDAETFIESNKRVINFTTEIYESIKAKSYFRSRKLIGQILHTVQDFYSHSNWVEMGKSNEINKVIGNSSFESQYSVAGKEDNLTCWNNCTLVETKCNTLAELFLKFIKLLNLKSAPYECPLKFYKCRPNIALVDKLVSGYYSGQKLEDGTTIAKPGSMQKCSHGGMLDIDSYKVDLGPQGGINKDSGYYLFSPRADLHTTAARLAINHTEFFFEELRKNIGNKEFATVFSLTPSKADFERANSTDPQICAGLTAKPVTTVIILNAFVIFFISKIYF